MGEFVTGLHNWLGFLYGCADLLAFMIMQKDSNLISCWPLFGRMEESCVFFSLFDIFIYLFFLAFSSSSSLLRVLIIILDFPRSFLLLHLNFLRIYLLFYLPLNVLLLISLFSSPSSPSSSSSSSTSSSSPTTLPILCITQGKRNSRISLTESAFNHNKLNPSTRLRTTNR